MNVHLYVTRMPKTFTKEHYIEMINRFDDALMENRIQLEIDDLENIRMINNRIVDLFYVLQSVWQSFDKGKKIDYHKSAKCHTYLYKLADAFDSLVSDWNCELFSTVFGVPEDQSLELFKESLSKLVDKFRWSINHDRKLLNEESEKTFKDLVYLSLVQMLHQLIEIFQFEFDSDEWDDSLFKIIDSFNQIGLKMNVFRIIHILSEIMSELEQIKLAHISHIIDDNNEKKTKKIAEQKEYLTKLLNQKKDEENFRESFEKDDKTINEINKSEEAEKSDEETSEISQALIDLRKDLEQQNLKAMRNVEYGGSGTPTSEEKIYKVDSGLFGNLMDDFNKKVEALDELFTTATKMIKSLKKILDK